LLTCLFIAFFGASLFFAAKVANLLAVEFLSLDPVVDVIFVRLDLIAARAAFWPRVTAPFCCGLGEVISFALDFFSEVRAARLPPFMAADLAALVALRTDAGDVLDGPPPGADENRPEASRTYCVRRPRGIISRFSPALFFPLSFIFSFVFCRATLGPAAQCFFQSNTFLLSKLSCSLQEFLRSLLRLK
jgi:hypothetical protein